jgi:hypothetical protein
MFKVLSDNDMKHWGARFITALSRPAGNARAARQASA